MRLLPLTLLLACTPTIPTVGDDTGDIGDTDSVEQPDRSDEVYDPEHLLRVELEIDPEDWETLRFQQRNIIGLLGREDCLDEPFYNPYEWFPASVTLDGELVENISVRKKGLIGSNDPARPSLKLDFDRQIDGQTWKSVSRLTLNNGRQDPSRLKTCMGYSVFADAGMAASRCSMAEVFVNGEAMGVYANVEPVKKPLLRRHFTSDEGNLYEGTLSDFRPGWTGTFDDKTDESDFADIQAVTDALQQPTDRVLEALEPHLDIDQFLRFWAMEVLIGHWDGYAGNTNNYYVYGDPVDGKLRFLPWGVDAVFQGEEPFGQGAAVSVVTHSNLAARLYDIPETRAGYYAQLEQLLEEVWDEDQLHERFEALGNLTDSSLLYYEGVEAHLDTTRAMRDFIDDRRRGIERELARGEPEPGYALYDDRCLRDAGTMVVEFSTNWGSYGLQPTFSFGEVDWTLDIDEQSIPVSPLGAVVGEYEPGAGILFISGQLAEGQNIGFYGLFNSEHFSSSGQVRIDWEEMTAYLLYDGDGDFADWSTWAYLGNGLTVLNESSTQAGLEVSGQVRATIFGG